MLNNIIVFQDNTKVSKKKMATTTLEVERFANSIEIEMSSTTGENCHIMLNFEEGKRLADFLGAWVGMLSV